MCVVYECWFVKRVFDGHLFESSHLFECVLAEETGLHALLQAKVDASGKRQRIEKIGFSWTSQVRQSTGSNVHGDETDEDEELESVLRTTCVVSNVDAPVFRLCEHSCVGDSLSHLGLHPCRATAVRFRYIFYSVHSFVSMAFTQNAPARYDERSPRTRRPESSLMMALDCGILRKTTDEQAPFLLLTSSKSFCWKLSLSQNTRNVPFGHVHTDMVRACLELCNENVIPISNSGVCNTAANSREQDSFV